MKGPVKKGHIFFYTSKSVYPDLNLEMSSEKSRSNDLTSRPSWVPASNTLHEYLNFKYQLHRLNTYTHTRAQTHTHLHSHITPIHTYIHTYILI